MTLIFLRLFLVDAGHDIAGHAVREPTSNQGLMSRERHNREPCTLAEQANVDESLLSRLPEQRVKVAPQVLYQLLNSQRSSGDSTSGRVTMWPVSTRVNKPANDDASILN